MRTNMKTVTHRAGILHVETPLGIVNIHVGLRNEAGQRVEAIELIPNRYAGEPTVTVEGSRFVEAPHAPR